MPELTRYAVSGEGVRPYTTKTAAPALAVLPAARALFGRRARYLITPQLLAPEGQGYGFQLGAEGRPEVYALTVFEVSA
ncbi:hypothetical protein WDJ50_11005 [Deinococcus sp. VB142]|uniref:Uncharacterized protein n=1 Tax=Deinococcus sp. VB142 TaxID=3112952 RepID=A0AAU6PZV3_9DEIO